MKKTLLSILSFGLLLGFSYAQTTVNITASKDNTLYESSTGASSNGAGAHIFIGRTQNAGVIRRALVQFDLSTLPANAVISSATLNLRVTRAKGGADTIYVHRALANWGEGTSNAPGQEGRGTTRTSGDATWIHTFFSSSLWTNPGGDFDSASSAKTVISGVTPVSISSAQLATDVQNWLNSSNPNFGWMLIGNERRLGSAKRLGSRTNGTASFRPTLSVTYNLTGITEASESKLISVYPIPTENFLVIEHRRNVFTNEVRVFDSKGQLVMDQKLDMDNRLNVEALESGIYFLELRTKDGNEPITKKFVKQ